MGCVSSTLLNQDETEFSKLTFSHHIVSLTSTTYGFLTIDEEDDTPPPELQPSSRRTLASLFPAEPKSLRYEPLETINSWDLMSGLDSNRIRSFRFTQVPSQSFLDNDENLNPNVSKDLKITSLHKSEFETLCPPNGENKVVMYSTTLRGVRKTFEDCNAVRTAVEGFGILISERDISMDRGFKEELRGLMKGRGIGELTPPRLFVKGKYIGGGEEVMKAVDEGWFEELVEGLPKVKQGYVCEGCGGVRFLPCFTCNGSCKRVVVVKKGIEVEGKEWNGTLVLRCGDCNENGLVRCPACI